MSIQKGDMDRRIDIDVSIQKIWSKPGSDPFHLKHPSLVVLYTRQSESPPPPPSPWSMHLYSVSCTVRFRSTSWWEYVRWRFTTLHKKYSLHEIDYFPNHCKGYFYVTQKYHGWESPPFLKSCVLQGPATSCKSLHRYIITPQVVLDSMLACWSTRSSDGGECLTSSRENSCMGFLFLVYGLLPVWTIFEAYSLSEPKYPFKIRFSVFFSFKIDNICMYIYLWNNNIGLRLGVEYVSNFEVLTDGCVS